MKRLTEQYNGEWVTEHAEEMDYFLIKGKAIDRLAAYEDTELTPEQVATLKAENEMLKSLTSDIPIDRLEEICKAYKEDRILILPKCPKCGLVNAWGIGKRNCDRCGALLYKQAEAALKESEDKRVFNFEGGLSNKTYFDI